MAVDPLNITNYDLTAPELEEHILFWVTAAGKNGVTAAKCLDLLLAQIAWEYPSNVDRSSFDLIKRIAYGHKLSARMKHAGIGCYNGKAVTFLQLAHSGFDLKTCTVDDLETITGIGPKTSRCFIMHSRPNQRLAGLDVHMLRYLRDKGYDVPKITPTGKRYKQIEQYFLDEANKSGKSVADFDLDVWKRYRQK